MKPRISNQKIKAMTLTEVLVVVVVLAVIAAIFLPALEKAKRHVSYINCVSNVKQIGLTFRVWADDNNGKFPMEVSVANGGTMELAATGDAISIFQVMSNELVTPKVLVCPVVAEQMGFVNCFATNFSTDLKNHISYFVGLDASSNSPSAFLCGDDNFLLDNSPANHGLVNVASNTSLAWDSARHISVTKQIWFIKTKTAYGNICLADGSVQEFSQDGLRQAVQQTGLATNRLAIP